MKKSIVFVLAVLLAVTFIHCSDNNDQREGDVYLLSEGDSLYFQSYPAPAQTFAFEATADWYIAGGEVIPANDTIGEGIQGGIPSWLGVSPTEGGKGEHEITLQIREANTTQSVRNAVVYVRLPSDRHKYLMIKIAHGSE